ncbi:centrosomal protein of 97 kDa-like isoform X1 [Varroa jacobsoni]|uniref:centrosomal protein of 97 kDa-like isoform X1 n=1 Tax=Varroa jacobsoni TaxID=62625 RepID=UPI000BF7DE8B|nr:centrosomal protein of 97 kDa-like isoform X1 [Varroa jacobsoni]XP_022695479.1 centrosomal protein of 97 kDa-like isoform X1 [Varroa jacobsoni]
MSDSSTCGCSGLEVDLSDQGLKRLERRDGIGVESLRLDNNQLQKLDNIDCYLDVWKLSVTNNQLTRMYYISKLHRLTHIDLSRNQILSIEGLKDLRHLQWLSLANNKLKSLQNIQSSSSLVHLDVSDNQIANLIDLSSLSKLKTLLLNRNSVSSLERASLYLPAAISVLGIAENKIADLTMVSFLAKLPSLEALSLFGNPCCLEKEPFDYRPYVINWCLGLRVLDDYVVTQRESLKAEWLYSQGKGRFYTSGQHQPLIGYLQQICPKQAFYQTLVSNSSIIYVTVTARSESSGKKNDSLWHRV